MFEDRDQLEFAISQYLDGTLDAAQRAALEARLATDPQAQALLEEYRNLDRTLRAAMPLPDVNWDNLQLHLSRSVARHDEDRRRAYSMTWVRRAGTWAVAACLVIAALSVLRAYLREPASTPNPGPVAVIQVSGPAQEEAQGAAVCQVEVGPAPSVETSADWSSDDGIVTRPSRIVIASDQSPEQDTRELPY